MAQPVRQEDFYRDYNRLQQSLTDIGRKMQAGGGLVPLVDGTNNGTLPTNPFNGQEVYYLVQNTPQTPAVVWHLMYLSNSASASKWLYLGGSALFTKGTTASSLTASTFTAYTGRPTDITLPLNGDYYLEHGSRMWVANGAGVSADLQLFVGSTGITDTLIDHYQGTAGSVTTLTANSEYEAAFATGLTAGSVVQQRYQMPQSNSGTFERPWMRVTPVRVG